MIQKHCPGCFCNKLWLPVCPTCGYDESALRSPVFIPHGTLLNEHYRIGRVLGRPGGFGVVYLAWDVHLQQRVAIKEYFPRDLVSRKDGASNEVIPNSKSSETAFRKGMEIFLREARFIARFDHPNIVRVRSFFEANSTAYIVMDYDDGASLGEYLDKLHGLIEPKTAVNLLAPVLSALDYMHQRGVLHRDVKPHNIYLGHDGRISLLDFGAAQPGLHGGSDSIMLSEGYAPLEQYQKQVELGPWTDIYGIAASLYRLIVGQPPPPALERIGTDPISANPPLRGKLGKVLLRGLALHAEQRFQSAAEFRAELLKAADIESSSATSPPIDKQLHAEPDTAEPATAPSPASAHPLLPSRGATAYAPHEVLQAFELAWSRLAKSLSQGLVYVALSVLVGSLLISAVLLVFE